MAELNDDISLITLQRDRVIAEQWHLITHGKKYGEKDRVYNSLASALSAIASEMWQEVETGTNWLRRS